MISAPSGFVSRLKEFTNAQISELHDYAASIGRPQWAQVEARHADRHSLCAAARVGGPAEAGDCSPSGRDRRRGPMTPAELAMAATDFRRWLASVRVTRGNKVYLQDRAYSVIDELQSNPAMMPVVVTGARQLEDSIRDLDLCADWFDAEDVAAMLWARYLDGWKG
jgi:hypothetical protein